MAARADALVEEAVLLRVGGGVLRTACQRPVAIGPRQVASQYVGVVEAFVACASQQLATLGGEGEGEIGRLHQCSVGGVSGSTSCHDSKPCATA